MLGAPLTSDTLAVRVWVNEKMKEKKLKHNSQIIETF